jgi:membrane peptidoglycan carboxypeptidase
MSETAGESRPGDRPQQKRSKSPSEARCEAYRQIIDGIALLFAAVAADRAGLTIRFAWFFRTALTLVKLAAFAGAIAFLIFSAAMLWSLYTMPLERQARAGGPSLLVEAAHGEPLGRIGSLADDIKREDFPDLLVNAVISIEDKRFYSHWGVDLWGIARAAYVDWAAGGAVQGGSTITQQFAKMQIVGNERSLSRKLREACTATWLELRLGKDEILTRYLNTVYLGSGIHGMSAAARMYFDKDVRELTLPEAALLAGLIQAPSKYNPIVNLDLAQHRAAEVIDAMRETKAIDVASAEKAKAQPAVPKRSPRMVRAGSWFADWIAKYQVPKLAGTGGRCVSVPHWNHGCRNWPSGS